MAWNAIIFGPDGTVWDGGVFKLSMEFRCGGGPGVDSWGWHGVGEWVDAEGEARRVEWAGPGMCRAAGRHGSRACQGRMLCVVRGVRLLTPALTCLLPHHPATAASEDYPNKAPVVKFRTRMFHPNSARCACWALPCPALPCRPRRPHA